MGAVYSVGQLILSVRGVSLKLGQKQILRDLDLQVHNLQRPDLQQGQVLGLLGPSGMGKTQLFRLLAGLTKPDSGTLLLGPAQAPIRVGTVGVVAQDYPLFRHRTVLGNLSLAGRLGGLSAQQADEKSRQLLTQFEMTGHEEKYPAQLSGGQRQRVAIAQQFMASESLLLLDEPFTGLDPIAVDKLCDFIIRLSRLDELQTFIVVTHDITAALRICDRVVLLGRDRDEKGEPVPGARIQHDINLVERGIAWQEGVQERPEFYATEREIHGLFARL